MKFNKNKERLIQLKDDVENFNKKTMEKDYESSFPNMENDTS